jgi:ribulose-5-phosphate 4-epimerase/fuculose-1-phosphate aldolase
MSDTEDRKQRIVRCIRMLERSDIMDYNGHASIRINDNRMLINIGSCQRSQLTVDDICTIDFDGNVIEGNGKPPLEFHLHAGIYKARNDVDAVVHCHPRWSTTLSTAGSNTCRSTRRVHLFIHCQCSIHRIQSTIRSCRGG